ncbi:MAG: shikimate dehydrogenase [Gammaproteobacteria bacterium]|nr:shikimate dehydrogenase [Gammaproteobacteria bacterium]
MNNNTGDKPAKPLKSPRFAVFGNPIEHSLSPQIHQAFAVQCGLEIEYDKVAPTMEDFENKVNEFFRNGGVGANVTLPFKERAYRMVHQNPANDNPYRMGTHTDHEAYNDAWTSHSANTLYLAGSPGDATNTPVLGCANTDGVGLIQDLSKNLGWELSGKNILLVGAGGAIRGIIPALFRAVNPKNQDKAPTTNIFITNRTQERTDAIISHMQKNSLIPYNLHSIELKELGPEQEITAMDLADKYHFDIIINGTSFNLGGGNPNGGAGGQDTAEFPLNKSLVHGGLHCYDLVYNKNGRTCFTEWARKHGAAQVSDGLGMLVEQAARSFCIWNSKDLEYLATQQLIKDLRSAK